MHGAARLVKIAAKSLLTVIIVALDAIPCIVVSHLLVPPPLLLHLFLHKEGPSVEAFHLNLLILQRLLLLLPYHQPDRLHFHRVLRVGADYGGAVPGNGLHLDHRVFPC